MSDKPKKFIKGHNALKAKITKPLSKSKELEKKKVFKTIVLKYSHFAATQKMMFVLNFKFWLSLKAEEAETAAVLNEYLADFQTGAAGGKAFIKAGVVNPGKGEGENFFKYSISSWQANYYEIFFNFLLSIRLFSQPFFMFYAYYYYYYFFLLIICGELWQAHTCK